MALDNIIKGSDLVWKHIPMEKIYEDVSWLQKPRNLYSL